MITPKQCNAARAMLGWSRSTLSEKSQVSSSAVSNFETGKTKPIPANLRVLKQTLKTAGVEFANDGDAEGVSLRADAVD